MKRDKGLFSLMEDCKGYGKQKPNAVKSAHQRHSDHISEAEVVETKSIQANFYDYNEPLSVNSGNAPTMEQEAPDYEPNSSYAEDFNESEPFFVEPFEDSSTEIIDEYPIEDKKTSTTATPQKPLTNISKPHPEKPEKVEVADEEFMDDLQSILKNKKDYSTNSKNKKPIEDDSRHRTVKKPKQQRQQEDQSGNIDEILKNEHQIFDKIAQSMRMANAYDLGSIALEQRFDSFEDEMDEHEDDQQPKKDQILYQKKVTTPPQADTNYQPAHQLVGKKKVLTDEHQSTPLKKIELIDTDEDEDFKLSLDKSVKPETAEFLDDLDKMSYPGGYAASFSNDIPLSPTTGGRSIGTDALEVGDIILSTTSDPEISGTIRAITRSKVSHAGVYIGNGKIIESIESGVLERFLDTSMMDDSVTVAFRHQDMTPEKAGVIRDFLTKKRKEKARFDHYAVIRNIPIQMITSACTMLASGLREKCRNFAGRIFLGTETNNAFYCSELVFAAFAVAELKMTNTDPQWTSAEDLVQLNYNGTLRYVGHLKAT